MSIKDLRHVINVVIGLENTEENAQKSLGDVLVVVLLLKNFQDVRNVSIKIDNNCFHIR